MNATETDKVMVPVAILDLLVQIALRTESGSALITGFRAGHPSLADKPGLRVEHPAVIRVEADRQ